MPREPLLKKSTERIGEILVRRGWISNETLGRALDAQARPATRRVGDILKASGQVSEEQLAEALAEQHHLEYVAADRLASGWRIDTALYSFKWKHLRMLPMRDPQDRSYLLVTEATADEKLILPMDQSLDASQIKFGVAATTVIEQILQENVASNELQSPPVAQALALPSVPDFSLGDAREALPGLAAVDVPRVLRIVGALWGFCAAELERHAVVALAMGARFRIEVRQIVAEQRDDLPLGYIAQVTSAIGRALDVKVTVPRSTIQGRMAEVPWPPVWPPPDLLESVQPMLAAACRVPASLKSSPDSLRWMGTRTAAREALNQHLVAMAGVSLGAARIDDTAELWAALRARARALDANQAVRAAWERWKNVQAPALEVLPGHVLALACLVTGMLPSQLAPAMQIEVTNGPVFAVELWKRAEAPDDDPAGVMLKLVTPG